jgi:hypothetical protein
MQGEAAAYATAPKLRACVFGLAERERRVKLIAPSIPNERCCQSDILLIVESSRGEDICIPTSAVATAFEIYLPAIALTRKEGSKINARDVVCVVVVLLRLYVAIGSLLPL